MYFAESISKDVGSENTERGMMSMGNSTTVRISQDVLEILKGIAAKNNTTVQATLERAVEDYRRRILIKEANAAYRVQKSSGGWKEELEEREVWDRTLLDE